MRKSGNNTLPDPGDWGLAYNSKGELEIGGCNSIELASKYGTPLHIVNAKRLKETVTGFVDSFSSAYAGEISVHYAFKCNPVPGIIKIIKECGTAAEVMSEFELKLAISLGFRGEDIIVNGPYKTDGLLKLCLESEVKLINIDSVSELIRLDKLCKMIGKTADILLRINPGFIPIGMNSGSATSSRKGSVFGLDIKGKEVEDALSFISLSEHISFRGFHMHIGTGIQNPEDYFRALMRLRRLIPLVLGAGLTISTVDIGGGLGVPSSREMTSMELLYYQVTGRLMKQTKPAKDLRFIDFAESISRGINTLFKDMPLPELIMEPGRCLTSQNQLLLTGIHDIKKREGVARWIITDVGIGTSAMPVFYEYHEIILCNDIKREFLNRANITGPGCFAADIVYKNKMMPLLKPGEILAIMDSGAYFTSWESNFGYPRPSVLIVDDGKHTMLRKREGFKQMVSLDTF